MGERPTSDVLSDSLHAVGVDGVKVMTSGCADGFPQVWYGAKGVTRFLRLDSVTLLPLLPGGQHGPELCTCSTRVAIRYCGKRCTFLWRCTCTADEDVLASGFLCVLKARRLHHGFGW